MEKCLDHRHYHSVEGDTDALYFAISGDKSKILTKILSIFLVLKITSQDGYQYPSYIKYCWLK
jgi:hypothetical protein